VSAHREEIAGAVALIEPVDALEAEHRAAVLDWIDSGDELYRLVPPDQPPMHLVSYFVPLDLASDSLLVAAHRKSGLVLPPGGHCEVGEMPWQTVQRECVEELGIPAVALPWLGPEPLFVTVTETQGSVVRRHSDVSLWHVIEVKREDERLRPDAGEFDGVHWLSFDELLAEPIERFDPHMHRFALKLRAAGQHAQDHHRGHPVYPRSPGMGCTATPAAVRN
jgi:8-oxo-dGTP pyrophosphatase MutT (NUDIX family)